MNDVELHARSKEIFLRACELDGRERDAYLASALEGADEALRSAVLAMLESDARPPALVRAADGGSAVRQLAREIVDLEEEDLPLPERIGTYRVVRLIGRGGMGAVFEVEQENPRRRVALKILAMGPGSHGRVRRLRQEAQLLARLQHPGIAQIHEAGTAEVHGAIQPWFAMEYVDGALLQDHARSASLGLRARVELVAAICEAVQHAHEQGVLHCDLKSSNVVVDRAGNPKVIDFGVARLIDRATEGEPRTTLSSAFFGTLATMSPEQVTGGRDRLDARSDVYSLGAIAYELLVGRLPLDVAEVTVPEAARRICEEPPARAGSIVPELAGDLETILGKALAKDREHRYATARALADDLRRWLAGRPIAARPPSAAYRLRLFARRNRALSAAATVAATALLLLGAFALWTRHREEALRTSRAAAEDREHVRSAQRALLVANPPLASSLLEAGRSQSAGWEWRRLHRELHGWVAEHPTGRRLVDAGLASDGTSAFAVAHDGWFARIDLTTGAVLAQLDAAPERSRTLAASRDGSTCIAFGADTTLVWDARSGAILRRAPLPTRGLDDPRGAACFAPSGRFVAARGLLHDLSDPDAPARAIGTGFVAFSTSPELLAVQDRGVAIVEPATGAVRRTVDLGFVPVAIALDPAARRLATSDATRVHVHDLESGERRLLSAVHAHSPNALAFRPDGARLVALQDDGSFQVHDPDADRVVLRGWAGGSSWKSIAAWSPDGALLLTTSWARGIVRLWDAREDAEVLRGHTRHVYPVAYTPDGARIVSGGWDRTVRVWNAATHELLATFTGHAGNRVQALAVSPDGRSVVSAGDDGVLVLWDLETGIERTRTARGAAWGAVAWSPRGPIAAARSTAGELVLLRAADLAVTQVLDTSRRGTDSLAYSHDGALLAAASEDGTLAIWTTDGSATARRVTLTGRIRSVAFSPDARELVAAGDDGLVDVVDVATLAVRVVLRGHGREVFAAAFSPDGARIATGGRDGRLRLWDAASGEEVGTFEGHTDYVWSLAFSPDGARIVTGSGDGTVRQWESDPAPETWARRLAAVRAATDAVLLVERRLAEDPSLPSALAWIVARSDLRPEQARAARDEILRRGARLPR